MVAFLKEFRIILSIVSIMVFALFFGDDVPHALKVYSFTLSNCMRTILLFLLPFLVFPYMVSGVASMKTKGAAFIMAIMGLILFSNFASIMIPYGVGSIMIPYLGIGDAKTIHTLEELNPLFEIPLKPLLSMEVTMLIAFTLGLWLGLRKIHRFDSLIEQYRVFSHAFFEKIFIPTLPIYVFGTMLKICYETDLASLLPVFGSVIALIVLTQLTYIAFLYYIGSGFCPHKMRNAIQNAFPSLIIGFSTMSSVVTMPVTLEAAEKNVQNPDVGRVIVSTSVNSHVVGECISLPFIALTLYFLTNGALPPLNVYLLFAFFTALAQFGGVAVPGGSIIIILPFLAEHLNFTTEMNSLIIALSIFLDPIGTANNVFGNGAFAMIVDRLFTKIKYFQKKIGSC